MNPYIHIPISDERRTIDDALGIPENLPLRVLERRGIIGEVFDLLIQDNCFSYASAMLGVSVRRKYLPSKRFIEVERPIQDDIIAYYNNCGKITHVGIVVGPWIETYGDNIIREYGVAQSKWGSGPVVRHPFGLVPASYGEIARFFRRVG